MKNLRIFACMLALTFTVSMVNAQRVRSLGALEFSAEGILFAGDKITGAIHAFDLSSETRSAEQFEINAYNIDAQVAAALGTATGNSKINDMTVHPITGEVFISVTRGHGIDALPALVKVNAESQVQIVDLTSLKSTSQSLNKLPDGSQNFIVRGTMAPPTVKEIERNRQTV